MESGEDDEENKKDGENGKHSKDGENGKHSKDGENGKHSKDKVALYEKDSIEQPNDTSDEDDIPVAVMSGCLPSKPLETHESPNDTSEEDDIPVAVMSGCLPAKPLERPDSLSGLPSKLLERQQSVDVASSVSADSLNTSVNTDQSDDRMDDVASLDNLVLEVMGDVDLRGSSETLIENRGSSENLLDNISDNSDSEMNTVKPGLSPDEVDDLCANLDELGDGNQDFYSLRFSQDPFKDEDRFSRDPFKDEERFGGDPDKDEDESEFQFDDNLMLDNTVDDQIVAAELLRPERLDTVEEVSEPGSECVTTDSLPHDGWRWPSQHTSITSADLMEDDFPPPPSLHSGSITSKEELYSVSEIEVVNTLQRKLSDERIDPFSSSSLGGIADSLTYVNNPFEIFLDDNNSDNIPGPSVSTRWSQAPFITSTPSKSTKSNTLPKTPRSIALLHGQVSSIAPVGGETKQEIVETNTQSFTSVVELSQTIVASSSTTVETSIGGSSVVAETVVTSSTTTDTSTSSIDTTVTSKRKEAETRLAKQLEEVREGIYKLLSEEEKDSGDNQDTEGDDESLDCDISSVIRPDIHLEDGESGEVTGVEKHEFEYTEKERMPPGWVGGGEGGEGRETDSGIERGVGGSSRVSSAGEGAVKEGWLARITARVNRFGSTGHSSDSSSPDLAEEGVNMESPREGGFAEGGNPGLEARVRELWIRLAQMEAEKIKAVEAAVEEERQKQWEAGRRDREAARKEREAALTEREAGLRAREEADIKMRGVAESQARQADLVNRLQARLLRYKQEQEEAEEQLDGVTKQARDNKHRLDIVEGVNRDLETRLETDKVLHASEIQELQVKLEEQEEKTKTINEVNVVLREQLDESRRECSRLVEEIGGLDAALEGTKREVTLLTGRLEDREAGDAGSGDLLNVWKGLAGLRRLHTDMKLATVRDLAKLRTDMAQSAREATTACLEVYTKSQYVVDSTGKEVAIGTGLEMWEKAERAKLEKRLEEERADEAERERDEVKRKLVDVEKRLEWANRELMEREEKSDKSKEFEGDTARIAKLEVEYSLLQSSLQDIATMVVEDADVETRSGSRPRPVLPGRSPLTPRRTRSASPAMVETTVTAVQAALNKRQLQLHELQIRSTGLKEKLEQAEKNGSTWEERCKEAEERLETALEGWENGKTQVVQAKEEIQSLSNRLEQIERDKEIVDKQFVSAKHELDKIAKERVQLDVLYERVLKERDGFSTEKESLEQNLKDVKKEGKEREKLITQLERIGSALREETVGLRERLASVERDQERLEMERTNTETIVTEEKKYKSTYQLEVTRLKKEESVLRELVTGQQQRELDLKRDVAIAEAALAAVREEVADAENKISAGDIEIRKLRTEINDERKRREGMELQIREVRSEKEDLNNQVTSLTLRKDALADEAGHLREEMKEIRDQLDRVYATNALLASEREKLAERLTANERELKELQDNLSWMEGERDRDATVVDEMQLEWEREETRRKEMQKENGEMNETIDRLNKEVHALKTKIVDGNRKLTALREELENEFEEERRSLEKSLKKMKDENERFRNDEMREKDELRSILEKKRQKDIDALVTKYRSEGEHREEELELLRQQVETLKARNAETVMIAENSRDTSSRLALSEKEVANQRVSELSETVEKLTRELTHYRKEGRDKLDKERSNTSEIKIEMAKLKSQLEDSATQHKDERDRLRGELHKVKLEKESIEQETVELRSRLRISGATLDDFKEKLKDVEDGKHRVEEELLQSQTEVADMKTEIVRCESKLEEQVLEKRKEIDILEKKIERIEKNEKIVREELEEITENFERSQVDSQNVDQETNLLQKKISDLTFELEALKSRSGEDENAKDAARKIHSSLKRKLEETELEKSKLETDLSIARREVLDEKEANKSRLSALQVALEDLRGRERRLEDERHDLELEVVSKGEVVGELTTRLTGAEGRLREMTETLARLEASKADAEAKVSAVSSVLQQLSLGAGLSNRPATPTRFSRNSLRSSGRGVSPGDLLDVESVRNSLKDLVNKAAAVERERDEAIVKLESVKKANDSHVLNTARLEEEKSELEQKMSSCQLQLNKLEMKVSMADETLANKEDGLERRALEMRTMEGKLSDLTRALEEEKEGRRRTEMAERECRERERRAGGEVSRLAGALQEVEEEAGRLESARRSLEMENDRMEGLLREKDSELQASRSKCSSLSQEVGDLELRCSNLTSQLNRLEGEASRAGRMEEELMEKVSSLSRDLSHSVGASGQAADDLAALRRRIQDLESEKRLLEDRLENNKTVVMEARKGGQEVERVVADLKQRLGEAEAARKVAERRLTQAGSNTGADNYLKEELNKARKENVTLQERAKELESRVKILKSERIETTNKMTKMITNDKERVVRTQIPMMGGGSHLLQGADCGEHVVRIRILEQEAERHLRRVKSLEQQMQEVEQAAGERTQQLLQERRQERERDHTRHAAAIKQLEHSLNSRERMYKERIQGLEEQVELLREQLSKEARSRRNYISSSTAIAGDVSDIRRQLDQSLTAVSNSTRHQLDGQLLDRETARLSETISRYSPDITSRLTPSKRVHSERRRVGRSPVRAGVIHNRASGSLDNLDRVATSTPQEVTRRSSRYSGGLRRNLQFDYDLNDVTT